MIKDSIKLLIESDKFPDDCCSSLIGKGFVVNLDELKSHLTFIESAARDIQSRYHLPESKSV